MGNMHFIQIGKRHRKSGAKSTYFFLSEEDIEKLTLYLQQRGEHDPSVTLIVNGEPERGHSLAIMTDKEPINNDDIKKPVKKEETLIDPDDLPF